MANLMELFFSYSICDTVGIDADGSPQNSICKGNIDEIYDAYLAGLQDYTINTQGDAGAWYVWMQLALAMLYQGSNKHQKLM